MMRRRAWLVGLVVVLAAEARGAGTAAPKGAIPPDDLTFRPTVIVRKGKSQGSGTVVSSVAGETLILTAAHVVEGGGPLWVELHRYNFGVEADEPAQGWPIAVRAEVAESDPAGDLAVVRFRGRPPLPYVARLAPGDEEPRRGSAVTSVGIDLGTRLSSWRTSVGGVVWLAMDEEAGERPFLVLLRAPEHGRSGGGLFRADGALVGVCVGRVEVLKRHRRLGIFASSASIRRMLRDHDLDAAIAQTRAAPPPAPPRITPTRSKSAR